MKKVFPLFVFAILFSSCVAKYTVTTSSIDLNSYTEKGFFISQSNSVAFDYEPVGVIETIVYTGYDKSGDRKAKDYVDGLIPLGRYRYANVGDAIDYLYLECNKKGANGLINLTFGTLGDKKAVKVSGMAIKRIK